jgi:hypothetical protein
MRKYIILLVLCLACLFPFIKPAHSWGFFAHKRINKMAVFTLPADLAPFYKTNISFIEAHAVDPDKRRYSTPDEAPRHYIDIEKYGEAPFDSIPKYWNAAVLKYSEDSLKAYGIVPWHIIKVLKQLEYAFKDKNTELILHYSADLGHYIADAYVPLHTTENYNGQLTNQKGIHNFWESRIPELKADSYDYWTGTAIYIDNPTKAVWQIIQSSYNAVDSVLKFEATLNAQFDSDKKYSFETKGKKTKKVYSLEYTNAYNAMLNGMVERRMKAAIYTIGSFWYTAWVNAGKPDVKDLVAVTPKNSVHKPELAIDSTNTTSQDEHIE